MNIELSTVTVEQLRRIIEIREKIEALEKELSQVAGQPAPFAATATVAVAAPKPKHKPGRTGMVAQKAIAKPMLAKAYAAEARPAKPAAKKKGQLSKKGIAAIAAAQKIRWAAYRAMKAAKKK